MINSVNVRGIVKVYNKVGDKMRKKDELSDYLEEDDQGITRFNLKRRKRKKSRLIIGTSLLMIIGFFLVINSLGQKSVSEENLETVENKDEGVAHQEEPIADNAVIEGQTGESIEGGESQVQEDIQDNNQAEIIEHEVKQGDSFYQLSLKYYDSVNFQGFIAEYNGLSVDKPLSVGQILQIPKDPGLEWHNDAEIAEEVNRQGQETLYEVKTGDTLYSLSLTYYGSAKYRDFIAEYNNITDPSELRAGTVIKLPKSPEVGY